MILVDTSLWIDHFRRPNGQLAALLDSGKVLTHPFVIGELALGDLRPRDTTLLMLKNLPQAKVAAADEVLHLIEQHRLFARGIGYVDAHLLAAVLLTGDAMLWTSDGNLRLAAARLRLGF